MTGMKKRTLVTKQGTPMLAYQFGSDDRLYTIAFKGMLLEPEIRMMLEILQKHLY